MMQTLIEQLDKYIDFTLLAIIVMASYWSKKFLCDLLPKWRLAWKVLLFSTLVTVVYYFFLVRTGVFKPQNVPVYIITYFAATSFYELAFAPLEAWVRKLTGNNEKEVQL